jgi:hypothetical protein
MNYLTLACPKMAELMTVAESLQNVIDLPSDKEDLQTARTLYSILGSLVGGTA